MKKKKSSGGGANWMDTYGDMVTLLLCFFVLLYSMSTISEENWKALVMSFNPNATETLTETSGNDGPNADPNTDDGSGLGLSQAEVDNDMEELYEAIVAYINQAQDNAGTMTVTKGDGKVYVSFNQAVFFDGDSWVLREESLPILDTVSDMLSNVGRSIDEIRIQGHTAQALNDRPNNPEVDRLLASNRATEVVIYIQEHSEIDPARLISEGYGQWRPKADNSTDEGKAQNRRVEMIISGRNIEEELSTGMTSFTTN